MATPRVPAQKWEKRTLTEVLGTLLQGDPEALEQRHRRVPIVRLAARIRDSLTGTATVEDPDPVPVHQQHQLLGLVWERGEGKVAERLDARLTIQGVIALPMIRSSEMDWGADAARYLAEDAARRRLALPAQVVGEPVAGRPAPAELDELDAIGVTDDLD